MRYHALISDYDGTLASNGKVSAETTRGLERLRDSGRHAILITGRLLDDLLTVFPRADLFDLIIAENGALLYRPSTRESCVLAGKPPRAFIDLLSQRGVSPLAVGQAIVATWQPHEGVVLSAIKDLGLELQLIFNKGAVMVLPPGVNKGTGLAAALEELRLSRHNAAGIGDAENDHSFLSRCECSAAVSNALPAIKERADLVTAGRAGQGVTEFVEMILESDLSRLEQKLFRHHILLGNREDGTEFKIPSYGVNVLIAGQSGGGKSTLATGFVERLHQKEYQFCIVDPEGDYEGMEGIVMLGDQHSAPALSEIQTLMENPDESGAFNLLGVSMENRPQFFAGLLTRMQDLRARTGRPHWIVVDEAHHVMPASWGAAPLSLPREVQGMMVLTVRPDHIARDLLALFDTVIGVGSNPSETIRLFCETLGRPVPALPPGGPDHGKAVAWHVRENEGPFWFRVKPEKTQRRRHQRKYVEGELGPDKSFYFRGAANRLNLRAQNLKLFLQLADGVDDDTWTWHLRRHEYSRWFLEAIGDEGLAAEAERVEQDSNLSPRESRARLREEIEKRYSAEP